MHSPKPNPAQDRALLDAYRRYLSTYPPATRDKMVVLRAWAHARRMVWNIPDLVQPATPMGSAMETITWSREKLTRLEAAHAQAVKDGKASFTFDGHEFVTVYAKYLIEYLRSRFK